MSASLQVCFIGLGAMGYPMAANLARKGHAVRVMDLDGAKVRQFCEELGATAAGRDDDLSAVDVVVTMLPDSSAVEAALVAGEGIARRLRRGAIVIDMSSAEPLRSRALARTLAESGIEYLDAPVSGGVKRAQAGSLAIMVGGNPAAFEACRGLFACLGANVFHVGPAGNGHAMKALNNYVSAVGLLAVSEALIVGRKFGLDPGVMTDVLNASTGRNNSTENKVKPFILSGRFDGGFAMKLMLKDLGIATGLGTAMACPIRTGAVCRDAFEQALAMLGDGADHTEIYRYVAQQVEGLPAPAASRALA